MCDVLSIPELQQDTIETFMAAGAFRISHVAHTHYIVGNEITHAAPAREAGSCPAAAFCM